jgi:superfamily II DNA or RNA helicase
MNFAVGSLVRARGREWVVLPESDEELLVLQPLGGTADEVAGILTSLEEVVPATFPLPTTDDLGDFRSARLLRDALRLGFRSSAGPFRSFGSLNFDPRPYQLVPLMMSLRLDPVRMLVADDVGTGKTASTLMIAAELLAQGKAKRLAVLCPPHLATQWQTEMREKFHLEAAVVLSSTASRLERGCQVGETLFDRHDITIVSTEYIKAERRRSEFLRTAPELIIVDEAHTCAFDGMTKGGRQLRHELLQGLAADPERNLILVTATPHSGKEEAFRSLITLLDSSFADLPEELSGEENRRHRERLARHMVQRRRADLRRYLAVDTPFPERLETETSYKLSAEGRELFDAAIAYARETVRDTSGSQHRQRLQWWSVLALLRSLASSPAAAVDTLEKRSVTSESKEEKDADAVGRQFVFDLGEEDGAEYDDETGGTELEDTPDSSNRKKMRALKVLAEATMGEKDTKLQGVVSLVRSLLKDGFNPIVFCRYIPTAHYVADELQRVFPKVGVRAVSGRIPSSERAEVVEELGSFDQRILVATDCLSEGINLQNSFDSIIHYDLSWNPTRHEQREGRVDRFGQPKSEVRVITYYGIDNRIDGLVLEVLIRKHKTIRTSLGYSVPIPGDASAVGEAILEGVLLREDDAQQMSLFEDDRATQIMLSWENVVDKEKRSRTVFAQDAIKPEEVARELDEVRQSLGTAVDVQNFFNSALESSGTHISQANGGFQYDLTHTPLALRDALNFTNKDGVVRFDLPVGEKQTLLTRTHPAVSGLAAYVLDTALDPLREGPARRAGVMRTDAVGVRTTLVVLRYRFDIRVGTGEQLLAEEAEILAFTGTDSQVEVLSVSDTQRLLTASPTANVSDAQAEEIFSEVIESNDTWMSELEKSALSAGERLLESHNRVRSAVRLRTSGDRVDVQLPVDVLGIFVLIPGKKVS